MNAVKVTLRTNDISQVKNTGFGNVLTQVIGKGGSDSLGGFEVSSIAALAPVDLMFGVDMSPSMEYETHFPNHPTLPSFYSFKLNDQINDVNSTSQDPGAFCSGGTNPCYVADPGLESTEFGTWAGTAARADLVRPWYKVNYADERNDAAGYKFETDSTQIFYGGLSPRNQGFYKRKRIQPILNHYINNSGELPIVNDPSGIINNGFYYGNRHTYTDFQRRLNTIATFAVNDPVSGFVPHYFILWNPQLVRSSMPGSGVIDRFHPHESTLNYKKFGNVKMTSNVVSVKKGSRPTTWLTHQFDPHKNYVIGSGAYRSYVPPFTEKNPGGYTRIGFIGHDMPDNTTNTSLGHVNDLDCEFPSSVAALRQAVAPYPGANYRVSWEEILDPDNEGLLSRFEIDNKNKRLTYRGIQPSIGQCGCDIVYDFYKWDGRNAYEEFGTNRRDFNPKIPQADGAAGVGFGANCRPDKGIISGCKFTTSCKFIRNNTLSTCSFSGYQPRGIDADTDTKALSTELSMSILYNVRLGGGDNPNVNTNSERYTTRDNYQCIDSASSDEDHKVDIDVLYGSSSQNGVADKYLVDRTGTQPLYNIYKLVNDASDKVKELGTGLDKVGFFAFDRDTPPIPEDSPDPETDGLLTLREYPLSSTYEDGKFNEDFEDLITMTDLDDSGSQKKQFDRFFFPRYQSETNGALGLVYALKTMNRNLEESSMKYGFSYKKRSLVLISDGIFSCNLVGSCRNNNYKHMINVYNEIANDVIPQYINAGIAINTVMVGQSANPHKLLRKSPEGGCMSDEEATQRDLPLSDGITAKPACIKHYSSTGVGYLQYNLKKCRGYEKIPSEDPRVLKAQFNTKDKYNSTTGDSSSQYFYANEFLEKAVARPTGGRFVPIMKPCKVSWCDSYSYSTDKDLIEEAVDEFCDNAGSDPTSGTSLGSDGLIINAKDSSGLAVTDDEGRVTCDLLCRDQETQLGDFVEDLFSDNSIVLVDSASKGIN